MRQLNSNEVTTISGGLSSLDVTTAVGANIGWTNRAAILEAVGVANSNVYVTLAAGIAATVFSAQTARLVGSLVESHIQPRVDYVAAFFS